MTDREWARIQRLAESFVETQRAMWSSFWPMGHCAVSSLLLAPMLRAIYDDHEWAVHVGLVAYSHRRRRGSVFTDTSPTRHGMPLRHAWCENAAGDVVDVTYGQFDACDPLAVLRAHEAGDLGHYTSWRLTLDEEEGCRRSIRSSGDGWSVGSSVRPMFEAVDRGA